MKKKNNGKKGILLYLLICVVLGVFIGLFLGDEMYIVDLGTLELFVIVLLSFYVQIIIHEGGHLVFGLLSGYKFSSFRIGNTMLAKKNGKLKFARLSLAGTGGQCLMVPPELADGKMPHVLYNLGGCLLNLITTVICFVLCKTVYYPYLSVIFGILGLVGFIFALANGIPMNTGLINNDGRNALTLGKDKKGIKFFWTQLKVAEAQTQGTRLRDMPAEWFKVPDDEDMKNPRLAAQGVFACARLMDEHKFSEAEELMKRYTEMDSAIVGIHRCGLICDLVFCEIIGENRKDIIDALMNEPQQKQHMRAMRNNLGVIRTQYIYSLLHGNDIKKTNKLKDKFEKLADDYPYEGEVAAEWELMLMAENMR